MKNHIAFCSISIKNLLFMIIVSLLILFSNLRAQNERARELNGIVKDAETGKPIEHATVFLSNTSLGVLTDKDGEYIIKNIPPGTYNLVSAIIGYSKVIKPVKISGEMQKIDFALSVRNIIAKEITVTSETPKEWQRRLKKFTKEFIGESSNAHNCEILNPEIIDFEINKNTDELIASAEDAILIVNHSLGYKIKVYLKEFVWSRSEGDGKYQIYPFFEEINSSDEKEKNNWQVNREKAFKGSFRHFLKSCVDGKVYEEGFRLCKSEVSDKWIYTNHINFLLVQEKAFVDSFIYPMIQKNSSDEYCMVYDSLLQIVYLGNEEDSHYRNYMEKPVSNDFSKMKSFGYFMGRKDYSADIISQRCSWLVLPFGHLFFNSSGICSDARPYGNKFVGYWAGKRVADILPFDYK